MIPASKSSLYWMLILTMGAVIIAQFTLGYFRSETQSNAAPLTSSAEPATLYSQTQNEQLTTLKRELVEIRALLSQLQSTNSALTASREQAIISGTKASELDRINNDVTNPDLQLELSDDATASDDTRSRQVRTNANARYQNEDRNSEWASDEEGLIQLAVENSVDFASVLLSEVDCRTDTCRLRLLMDEAANEPHTELALVAAVSRRLPNVVWQKDGEQLTLLLSR